MTLSRKALLPFCLLPLLAQALPEDRDQELIIDFTRSETFLDQGMTLFYGTPDQPAVVTQGSMRISGLEIRVELDGEQLRTVTATGSPARFQQQPAADQAVLHASGRSITFDNQRRFLTIDGEAHVSQEGTGTIDGQHIEYDLEAGRLSATRGEDGEPIRMVIPPPPRESQNGE